jgi:hypothetical protein
LIVGVAAFASAMFLCERTRGQNVYSLNAGSFLNINATFTGPNSLTYHEWGVVSPSYGYYGIEQGSHHPEGTPEPNFQFTAIHFGSHNLRVRTPECLIVNRRRVTVATSALLASAGLASFICFRRSRPCAIEPGRNS